MKNKKRVKNYNRYPNELKRKLAKEYLAGNASYGILAEEHGLRNKGVVKEFVKWYKKILATENEQMKQSKHEVKKTEISSENKDMELELKELRKKLEMSELKVELLETIIDEAETELSIDIRKKSGTNPSQK